MSTRLNNWIAAATGTLLVAVMATGTPAQPESRGGVTDAGGVEGGEIAAADAGCQWDITGFDGDVGIEDFLDLLAAWGPNAGHPADFDGDGFVGIVDFLDLLGHWGPCP
jgi:hypothetical protein